MGGVWSRVAKQHAPPSSELSPPTQAMHRQEVLLGSSILVFDHWLQDAPWGGSQRMTRRQYTSLRNESSLTVLLRELQFQGTKGP